MAKLGLKPSPNCGLNHSLHCLLGQIQEGRDDFFMRELYLLLVALGSDGPVWSSLCGWALVQAGDRVDGADQCMSIARPATLYPKGASH